MPLTLTVLGQASDLTKKGKEKKRKLNNPTLIVLKNTMVPPPEQREGEWFLTEVIVYSKVQKYL